MVSHLNEVYLCLPYLSFPLDSEQLEAKRLFLGHYGILTTYLGPGTGKSVLKGGENCGQKCCDELWNTRETLMGLKTCLSSFVHHRSSAPYSEFQKD